MPLVNVTVNQRSYVVACGEGEEDHLRELAAHVDAKARELLESIGQVGEQRLLLMAALVITDDYLDTVALLKQRDQQIEEHSAKRAEIRTRLDGAEQEAAVALEAAARRVEDIAARLAEA